MDPRWKHPFPALVAGPTCCGKSQFVKRLLEAGEDMIDGAPENIIWCYSMYQPAYDEMLKTIPNIMFVEGVPGDLETLINPSIRNLVVIDDLMHELSNDQRMTNSFAKGCHHRNPSRRMPIVLGTFTSSSTKFVDLSYYAQSCRDSMKALQPLVAKNARRSSSICCRWKTKQ